MKKREVFLLGVLALAICMVATSNRVLSGWKKESEKRDDESRETQVWISKNFK